MGLVNPALYWLLIGLMMFFLALAMPGFVLYIFALGALTTALAVWFFPGRYCLAAGSFYVSIYSLQSWG